MSNSPAGKGDSLRKGANLSAFWDNYDLAFRKRKTVADWAAHFGDRIKSYDGFREYNQDDLLTEKEYQDGLTSCTMYVKAFNSAKHLTSEDDETIRSLEKSIGLDLSGLAYFLDQNPKKAI